MSKDTIRKFAELIREKTKFKPVRKKGEWWLKRMSTLKLLEIPLLPQNTKRVYFNHLFGNYISLSDILHYMHFSLEDRQLGDLFQIRRKKIFGKEPKIAWRNPHYVVDYLDPLDYVPTYLSKQTRAMVEVVRVLDRYGARGESESNAGDYLFGFPFRADYAVYNMSRVLFIEYDEPHHEDGMRDMLVDQAKSSLNQTHSYAYLSIKENTWYSEGGRSYYLAKIVEHVEKHHLEALLDGFRRFNQQAFDAFERGFGKEVFQQLIDQKFGCVLPLSQVIEILEQDDRAEEIRALFTRRIISQKMEEDVVNIDDDDDDDGDDDGDDDDDDDDDEGDDDDNEEKNSKRFAESIDYIEGSDDTLMSLSGLVKLSSHVQNEISRELTIAATDLFKYSFERIDKLAPTALTKKQHYLSSKAISRVSHIKATRRIEYLEDQVAAQRKMLEDAGLVIGTK